MPVYPWLIEDKMELDDLEAKISAMRTLGVPYPEGYEEIALSDLQTQADEIAANLEESGVQVPSDRDIIALIAYLQRLGTDIQVNENEEKKSYEIKPLSEQ
jgi:cytochrome c oxidase cbb3-type subunit I/II